MAHKDTRIYDFQYQSNFAIIVDKNVQQWVGNNLSRVWQFKCCWAPHGLNIEKRALHQNMASMIRLI
jgi:hypothetical protein